MSTFKVEIVAIKEVVKHANADRLEIVKVYDWNVVTQKGKYAVGDVVVYLPVDSVLPLDLEQRLFPPDSKITLHKSRIRSIRIRGEMSQGMVIDPKSLKELEWLAPFEEGQDVTQSLAINKYEPPATDLPGHMQARKSKKKKNSNFKEYTDIENFKYYDRIFQDGEAVYISEKLHGTSFRAGWFPAEAHTWWRKILKFFRLLPKWQFCWGSRTVQIQEKLIHRGYYDEDVYTKMVKHYDLPNLLPKGTAIYGEIVGGSIQKNYSYGYAPGEHDLYVYDIQHDGVWTDYPAFVREIKRLGLKCVPWLYTGPFSREVADKHRTGDSTIGNQKVREGVVIKPVVESKCCVGRKILKFINDDYYLNRDNSDFH